MRLKEPLRTNLAQLSTYHIQLSEILSQSLDDLVTFECYCMPEYTLPLLPPTQSCRDHGYSIRPLFEALYIVYDDQFEDHDEMDKPAGMGEYASNEYSRQSNDTVLLVRTGKDSHLSSPISFLPLFESGLAFNVNRPDYQDEPEPTVVRVKLKTALQFIGDLLKKEEATQVMQRSIQEQDKGCQRYVDSMIEYCREFGIDSHEHSWFAFRRVRARLENEAFEEDQVNPPWKCLRRWTF
jgi:hypothetical protein